MKVKGIHDLTGNNITSPADLKRCITNDASRFSRFAAVTKPLNSKV